MAGFFGLFNSKTKYVDEPDTDNTPEEFFLDPDEAKTLGNIEYMRKPSVIRKSFPKSASQEGGELIKEVSSLSEGGIAEEDIGATPTANNEAANSPNLTNMERRNPDDGMELFRNMARQIKK